MDRIQGYNNRHLWLLQVGLCHKIRWEYFPCLVKPWIWVNTVYPKKYAHGFCFAVLGCGYTLTDFPIPIRLTSLALWQSNDCPSASKATLMNMDKYFTWIHYERLHNHNKAKHNKTVCIFLGIYCIAFQSIGKRWYNNTRIDPAHTWRNNNAIITSNDVVLTW